MRIGKLDNASLEKLVLSKFSQTRPEVLSKLAVGEDCAVLDMGGDFVVLSSDPITAAAENIGSLSVHINCNDAIASGAIPVGLLVTLLAPPTTTEEEIDSITDELSFSAKQIGIDILGGHTEITDAVTRIITSSTVVARVNKNTRLIGMQPDDDIVMTKWAGLEGGVIMASDYEGKLSPHLSLEQINTLKGLLNCLSVVPEGKFALNNGATAMHDITEGGVLGAAWELSAREGIGITLIKDAIPVLREIELACEVFNVDMLRLISSGCMLVACTNGTNMVKGLNELGIAAAVIGKATGSCLCFDDGEAILPPNADEIYKLTQYLNG